MIAGCGVSATLRGPREQHLRKFLLRPPAAASGTPCQFSGITAVTTCDRNPIAAEKQNVEIVPGSDDYRIFNNPDGRTGRRCPGDTIQFRARVAGRPGREQLLERTL